MAQQKNPAARRPNGPQAYRDMQDTFIAGLRKGEPVKSFKGDARLEAALLVGQLYATAMETRSSTEICEALSDLDKSKEPFRIHRWLIKSTDAAVTDELRRKYAKRPEPQKKIRVYIELVDQLARMIGDDPFARVWELLERTRLTERLGRKEPSLVSADVEPRQRLASLLNLHAAHICEVLDIPALWQKAEKLQMGWDMSKGPVPIPIDQGIMQNRFRSDSSATQLRWLAFEAPPYPSVRLGRLPVGSFSEKFEIRRILPASSEHLRIDGQLALYWDLWLTIAPVGRYAVGSFLSRIPGFGLNFPDGKSAELSVEEGALVDNSFKLSGQTLSIQTVDEADFSAARPVQIHEEEVWQLSFPPERFDAILSDPAMWSAYIRPARIDVPDDIDDEEMPFIRTCRVTQKSVADWLEPDFTIEGIGRFLPQIHLLPSASGERQVAGWITHDCIARDVEQALHSGVLDQGFKAWTDAFRPELDRREDEWSAAALAAEADLRERWHRERLHQE